jgi:Leucine-rich repeat (LRR) protein
LGTYTGLQQLSISSNNLTSLAGGAFQGLGALKSLTLSMNSLMLQGDSEYRPFAGLSSLHDLDLSFNSLSDVVGEPVFDDLKKTLQWLDVSHNHVPSSSRVWWPTAGLLKYLNLSYNDLTSLRSDMFGAGLEVSKQKDIFFLLSVFCCSVF